jgi:CheY-like chemotaxis protein
MERRTLPRPQRVLVVDDSDDIRDLWCAWLTLWGFQVEEAANGHQAVEKARAGQPDLVLMDMWMPVLDGIDATALIKADTATAHVPVLALSAHVFPPAPERALAAGCETFLPKPVDPEVLLEEIRQALRRVRERQGGES